MVDSASTKEFEMKRQLCASVPVMLAFCLLSTTASAQGVIATFEGDQYADKSPILLSLQSLDVDVAVTEETDGPQFGAIIKTIRNYTTTLAPATFAQPEDLATASFVFYRPLALGSQVTSVTVDGVEWAGEVLEPAAADALRKQLVMSTRDPVFLRDLGRAMFVSEPLVGQPVQAFGAGLTITTQLEASLAPHGTLMGVDVPVDYHRNPAGSVSVNTHVTTVAPLRTLYSPYHTLTESRASDTEATASYTGYQRCTSYDVSILLSTGYEPIRLDMVAFRDAVSADSSDAGTWMGFVSTRSSSDADPVEARDIALVVDRSGSMNGEKMAQAQNALNLVLGGLRHNDRVALIAFDGNVEAFAPDAQPADAQTVEDAQAFVDDLVADGGTNIHDALSTAFASLPSQSDRPRYIVLMTDGQATSGITETEAILEMARSHNEIGARIFAFGIGYDVNTHLLDRLALDSAGDSFYVRPNEAVDTAVTAFFDQILDPVLTNPTLDVSDFGGSATYPQVMNDLFAGQTVTLFGRYAQAGPARITLSGMVGGTESDISFDVVLPERSTQSGFAPRIWARRRVGDIFETLKLTGPDDALIGEAMQLARRYDVATNFTYFSLTEEGDMVMTWAGVSSETTGADAVNTSSSIDSYQKGGTYDVVADALVRYETDRTYPIKDGYFTDTTLIEGPPTSPTVGAGPFVDLHLGSQSYWDLVEAEAGLGIGVALSVGSNARLNTFGRRVRITDAESEELEVPAESGTVPPAASFEWSDEVGAQPTPVVDTPDNVVDGPGQTTDDPSPNGHMVLGGSEPTTGCSSVATGTGLNPFGLALIAFAMLLGCIRLRRTSEILK
ncbi:MAG: Ca-activated chloride channel family protein [Myxococcota bacterium]|jgi:Ca-activated chloride channel family protein